jgi:pyrimidine operon attenuation protein/uracil phosphoribosyltransferase
MKKVHLQTMVKRSKILDSKGISQKINRLAWQIYENNLKQNEIFIFGVAGRGEVLASELSKVINHISLIKTTVGTVYLDKDRPYGSKTTINLDVLDYTNKVVVLVDDVLNSGKTLMYASKYFLTNPIIKLSTVVLIDRTHNRYPIKADYVGLSLATTLQEYISVVLDGNAKGVYLS